MKIPFWFWLLNVKPRPDNDICKARIVIMDNRNPFNSIEVFCRNEFLSSLLKGLKNQKSIQYSLKRIMQDLHIDTRIISGETAPHSAELYVFMSHLKSALNEFHRHFFPSKISARKKLHFKLVDKSQYPHNFIKNVHGKGI